MIDMQRVKEERGIMLEKAGIKRLRYPIRVRVNGGESYQTVVATVELSVEVPFDVKGTHMSRFTRILNKYKDAIHGERFMEMIRDVRTTLESSCAYGSFSFPYYIEKPAPVSREMSFMEYLCVLEASSREHEDELRLTVIVPITTLCPCSKAISEAGAHNQRADVKVIANISKEMVWIEDIIEAVEDSASSPLYSLLKRVDEKYVTEEAYKNPQFVEDVVREVYKRLEKLYRSKENCDFIIECESQESIHNHNAFASTSYRAPEHSV